MIVSKKMLMAASFAVAAMVASPGVAHAQLLYADPALPSGPIEPNDPLIGTPLPNATPAEARAALLWNLRAGLNVAALRCQFSKYLRAVDNYNAVLAHHSAELRTAYTGLGAYFRRLHGAREGQRRLDNWATGIYNDFSSVQAQSAFCQTASHIAKDALTRRKGQFYTVARDRLRELRNSLRDTPERLFTPIVLRPLPPTYFSPVPGQP